MKIILGQTEQGKEVSLDVKKFFNQGLLIQGISGSRTTSTINHVMRQLKLYTSQETIQDIVNDLKLDYSVEEFDDIPQVIFDFSGKRADLYNNYGNYIVLSKTEDESHNIDVENASIWGEEVRKNQSSVIIDLSSFKSIDERETIVSEFISAIIDADREYWKPCIVLIDEGHNLCKEVGKCHSKDSIIRLCETGRKRGLVTIMVTQRLAQLNKNALKQIENKIIGKMTEFLDRDCAMEILENKINNRNELEELGNGEFIGYGNAVSENVIKFKTYEKTPRELVGLSKPPLTLVNEIKSMLEKIESSNTHQNKNEMEKIHLALNELSNGMDSAELIGYSKAMEVIRKRTHENKSIEKLQFSTRNVRGTNIVDVDDDE